jgi:uncharacterized protein YjbI with pentapeptide repeats
MAPPKSRLPQLPDLDLHDVVEVSAASLRPAERRDGDLVIGADLAGVDLHAIQLDDCEWRDVVLDDTDLTGSRLRGVLIERAHAATFRARRSVWRDVRLDTARLGSAEMWESDWAAVEIRGGKLDYLNLRSAKLVDVTFGGCVIGDLDLEGCTVERMRFTDCSIRRLSVRQARLSGVDLRGAEFSALEGIEGLRGALVSQAQLLDMAPLLAEQAGIEVAP